MANLIYPQGSIGSAAQIGLSWVCFFDDFSGSSISATADAATWLRTVAGTGTASFPDTGNTGEIALFGTAATDVVSIQLNGSSFKLLPGKVLRFETRLKVSGITTDTDELWGMAPASVLPLLTTGLPLNSDFIGLVKSGATANVDAITQTATASKTTTAAVTTLAADTYKIFRVEWDGVDKIRFMVDGALVATHTTNISAETALLIPTFALQTIDAGAADFTFTIDYVATFAQR